MKNKLLVIHANVNSVNKNLDSLLSTLQCNSIDFDILCLSETKLCDFSSELHDIPGYSSFSVHRNSHGGGVRIYVRDHFGSSVLDDLTGLFPSHESVFLRVNVFGSVFVIGGIYRPPSCSIAPFNQFLEHNLLVNRDIVGHNCIILGDFNINLAAGYVWPQHCELLFVCYE